MRNEERVELRSCMLTFDRPHKGWRCEFSRIKPALFDELWLAIYTFVGIYFYRSKCCKTALALARPELRRRFGATNCISMDRVAS